TPIRQVIQAPQPSYLTQSPSGYTCSLNYQINTNIHINNICTLSSPSSSIFDSTASNSLFTDNVSYSNFIIFILQSPTLFSLT
ncbi:unnamed protein product, partial [Adineta steineri]